MLNKRFMGRAAAVMGLTALCSTLITPVPALAEASKVVNGSECADYTVIGMRGSNTADMDKENVRNRSEEDLVPFGGEANGVYAFVSEALRTAAPSDKSIKFVEVSYSPVDEYIGFGGTLHAEPKRYKEAIDDGSKKFIEEAHNATSSCADTKVILFGYGQGAGVVRVSMEKLNQKTHDSIKAVWFMSDTMHDGSGADGFEYFDGYSGRDKSVNGFMRLSAAYFEAERVAEEKDEEEKKVKLRDKLKAPIEHSIPDDLKSKILSMCDYKDGFCSPSEDINIMIDSSPWHYAKSSYLNYGSKRIFEISSGVKIDDSKASGIVRSSHEAQIMHRGDKGATWVVEKDKSHLPELVTACISDYAVIGVRGSGEHIEGSNPDEVRSANDTDRGGLPSQDGGIRINGFSDIVATAAWGIKENLPQSSTVRFIPVSYPAQAVPMPPFGGASTYLTSVDRGRELTLDAVRNLARLCPNTKIVLMGYSQGSMSAHLALTELETDYRKSIAAVYLIADPIRNSKDARDQFYYDENSGDSFAQIGESNLFDRDGVARRYNMFADTVPTDMNARIIQVCHTYDDVCNFRGVAEDAISGFTKIHPKVYNEESQFWGFPPQWAASKLVRARSAETIPQFSKANDSVFSLDDKGYKSSFFSFEKLF